MRDQSSSNPQEAIPNRMHLVFAPHKQISAGLRLTAFALLLVLVPALLRAQEPNALPPTPAATLPAAPASSSQTPATLTGTVTDPSGAVVSGASVILENSAAHARLTATTDANGIFTFTAVPPGTLTLTLVAIDFSSPKPRTLVAQPGQAIDLQAISLQLAPVDSTVDAASEHEIAEQQIHVEEQQRIFGVVPNFYASYVWNAAPLSPGQKFHLALRASVDPFNFVDAGVAASVEQAQDTYPQYGQGAPGFAKRYGANYADTFIGTMIGGAILPVVFHQDPRYFYKGTGSPSSRALYAISTVFRARGDDGHWEPNYSNLLGDIAAGAVSNLYYPADDRGVQHTLDNAAIAVAGNAAGALFQEFVLRKLTRHPPPAVPPAP
jgi:Carboxypeptidase regulatory-like domain